MCLFYCIHFAKLVFWPHLYLPKNLPVIQVVHINRQANVVDCNRWMKLFFKREKRTTYNAIAFIKKQQLNFIDIDHRFYF